MKKILLLLMLVGFVWYLYNLGLQNGKIEQAKTELVNTKEELKIEENKDINKNIKEIEKESEDKLEKNNSGSDLYNLDKITYEKRLIGTEDNGVFMGMPEGDLFGQVLSLGKGQITYSKITDLVIEKKEFDKNQVNSSDNIWNIDGTGYLNENYDSYVYWNTLRNIDINNKESGVSFYVLYKQDEKLIYEKLYFDFNHGLIGRLKIKEVSVDNDKKISDQMSELNKELKEKNKDFDVVKKTDFLFKEIVR